MTAVISFGFQRQAKVNQEPLPLLFDLNTTATDLVTSEAVKKLEWIQALNIELVRFGGQYSIH
jgi:hypothetical protein